MSRNPKSARYDFNFEVPSNQTARVNSRAIPGGKKCKKAGTVVPSPHQIEISGGVKLNTGRGEIIDVEQAIKPLDGGKKPRCKKAIKAGAIGIDESMVNGGALKVEAGKKPRGKKAGMVSQQQADQSEKMAESILTMGGGVGSFIAHTAGDILDIFGLGKKKPRGKKGGALPVEAGALKVEAGAQEIKGGEILSDIAHGVGDVLDIFGLGKKKPRGKKGGALPVEAGALKVEAGKKLRGKKGGAQVIKAGFQSGPMPSSTNPMQTQNPITQDRAKKQGGAMAVKAGKKKEPSQWIRCVQAVRKITGGSYSDSMSASKELYYDYQRDKPNMTIEQYLNKRAKQ